MEKARPTAMIIDRTVELARLAIVTGCALALAFAGQALPF